MTQNYWRIFPSQPQTQLELCSELEVHPVIAQLLINRGIDNASDARRFISGDVGQLHDPFLLKDMGTAVERVQQAKRKGERVIVFGDYDVDGVTSTVLMTRTLRRFGLEVIPHIPHRMNDGYGLNEGIATIAKQQGVTLLVSVDCGVTSVMEIELLNTSGVDVIVVDHHEPLAKELPHAVAVVDPKRKDCTYPFKHLAAVGLVAKFTQALLGTIGPDELEMVALGTIADVVPLLDENRIFVKAGLPHLSETKNTGLAALMDVAGIRGKKLRPYSVGFVIGPRINATGRMDSAHKSLDLLLTEDPAQARLLAEDLNQLNSQRQKLQKDIFEEARGMIDREVNFKEHRVIVLSREGWHKGVLGIVASKVSETFSRPAVIISTEEGWGTASARSIEGFHLHEVLGRCAGILEGFGGHKFAAGLTIREEKIAEFRRHINQLAAEMLRPEDLFPHIEIEAELALHDLNVELITEIEMLEPYGEGNREPVFCARNVTVKSAPLVCAKETIKFWVADGPVSVSAVGFGMAKFREFLAPGQKIDIAYQLIIDDWNKAPTVQLKLKDIREAV